MSLAKKPSRHMPMRAESLTESTMSSSRGRDRDRHCADRQHEYRDRAVLSSRDLNLTQSQGLSRRTTDQSLSTSSRTLVDGLRSGVMFSRGDSCSLRSDRRHFRGGSEDVSKQASVSMAWKTAEFTVAAEVVTSTPTVDLASAILGSIASAVCKSVSPRNAEGLQSDVSEFVSNINPEYTDPPHSLKPKPNQRYGYFKCADCQAEWKSYFAYDKELQRCIRCDRWVTPWRLEKIRSGMVSAMIEASQYHDSLRCTRCAQKKMKCFETET